ncbi:hypothetical protein KIN20_010683 [Parelaphostrongylus tenuis]|uniref:DUF7774 domain-containing protein n=1 Tax=Parelaphostrongylus tenuis TaxID=148309 RepID=A0AAD5QKF6_PARTN|nr:hypothetical protein KIN20_010683 [Parelaphostrongylus tenuis]
MCHQTKKKSPKQEGRHGGKNSLAQATSAESETVESVNNKKPRGTRKDDVFGALEEDVDLTKVLGDFNVDNIAGVGSDDVGDMATKRTLDTAQKILKVAYKEKAFEKTLTKEENDTLAKFFSGKIPYDASVLNILDEVLDKTIEYFRTHKTNLDPETKALIEQREALKAAMLQTMLSKPTFIPSEWVKQYEGTIHYA